MIKKLLIIIMILCSTSIFCGCNNIQNKKEVLTEKKENKIVDAWCDLLNEDIGEEYYNNENVFLCAYFGQYNGGYVIAFPGNEGPMGPITINVAGYTFEFYGTHIIHMYYRGNIYSFDKAFKKGLLSKRNIGTIYEKYTEIGGFGSIGNYPEDDEFIGQHKAIICCDEVDGMLFVYPQLSKILLFKNNEFIEYSYEEITNVFPNFNINNYMK